MWAFLVIVDNKSDLWVMAISLLALLAWLIFIQKIKDSKEKKEVLKYIIIAWLFFWFAALAKITAFVDFALFGLLLVGLWMSPVISLWLWMIVIWLVRKLNILTSSVMLTDTNAFRFIIIWLIIAILWLIIHLLKRTNRRKFWNIVTRLLVLLIGFLVPLIIFKLPRTTVTMLKNNSYSVWNSLKSVLLTLNTDNSNEVNNRLLIAQNVEDEEIDDTFGIDTISGNTNSLVSQDYIDTSILNSKNDQTFSKCLSDGNIYSEYETI